jgi:predicted nucleotidyltransferase
MRKKKQWKKSRIKRERQLDVMEKFRRFSVEDSKSFEIFFP